MNTTRPGRSKALLHWVATSCTSNDNGPRNTLINTTPSKACQKLRVKLKLTRQWAAPLRGEVWCLPLLRGMPRRDIKRRRERARWHWCGCRLTGVDKGAQGAQPPLNCRAEKNFFVKIEGLLEPVVLNLSFRVRSNAMFTSERRYQCYRYQNIKNSLKLSALFSTKLVKILKL